jgi:hypothetical protein
MAYGVRTIIESPLFNRLWPDYWSEEERGEFAIYAKSARKDIPAHVLRQIAEEMGHATT